MNFSRFSAFSAITGPAERKNSLQMRRFQTISEFSHGLDPKQSLAAADHSAFSAMEQHKPELNRKSRVDRCLQLCFISNSKLSWGGDIGNDDQNRAFEQAGFGVL
jgi:hypothetical protein